MPTTEQVSRWTGRPHEHVGRVRDLPRGDHNQLGRTQLVGGEAMPGRHWPRTGVGVCAPPLPPSPATFSWGLCADHSPEAQGTHPSSAAGPLPSSLTWGSYPTCTAWVIALTHFQPYLHDLCSGKQQVLHNGCGGRRALSAPRESLPMPRGLRLSLGKASQCHGVCPHQLICPVSA